MRSRPGLRSPVALVAGVLAALVVGVAGGFAYGELHPASARSTAGSSTATPQATSTPSGKQKGTGQNGKGLHGRVSALTAGGLTLAATDGSTVTVTITDKTTYGTKKKPESRSDISAGSQVVVFGKRTGDAVRARRVVIKAGGHRSPSPAGTSPD